MRSSSGPAPRRTGPTDVVIDAASAEENDIELGSTIKVLFQGPTREFTVVGTVGFGDEKSLGGSSAAYFDAETAQEVLGEDGVFDSIGVAADDGVSQSVLADRLDEVVPAGTEAVTGKDVSDENATAIKEELKMVGILFTMFAGIALFVGAFIIWNTFTMIVTQRSREIALLRAVGATRRQVLRGLILEATVLGTAASALGIATRRRSGQGPQRPDDLGRLQPAEHLPAARAAHRRGRDAGWDPGHRRLGAGPGSARHQGAAHRGPA